MSVGTPENCESNTKTARWAVEQIVDFFGKTLGSFEACMIDQCDRAGIEMLIKRACGYLDQVKSEESKIREDIRKHVNTIYTIDDVRRLKDGFQKMLDTSKQK